MSARNSQICFLCDSNSSSSYHRFPKNPSLRSQWMKICHLQATEEVDKLRICGIHFSRRDMYTLYSGRKLLKTGALPSPNVGCSYLLPRYDAIQGSQSCRVVSKELPNEEQEINCSSGEIHNDDFNANEELPKDKENLMREQSNGSVLKETENAYRSFKRNYEEMNFESEPCQKKQKAYNIQKMKKKMDVQKVKIRLLQQKNRRLAKKIDNLKQLLVHLKSRNLISTGACDHLMVGLAKHWWNTIRATIAEQQSDKDKSFL